MTDHEEITPPGQPGNCRGCHAPIRWVRMETTKKMNPLDPEPSDNGNVVIDADSGEGTTLGPDKAATLRDLDIPLYISHFATCPRRGDFGKKKP